MPFALFTLWFFVALFAWVGRRRSTIVLFVITLVLSCIWFQHHLTDTLHINL